MRGCAPAAGRRLACFVRPLIRMNPQSPSRLPRRVLFALIGVTVVGALVVFAYGVLSGWVPPRESAGVVLPLYFAMLLAALTLSFVISGNTLMHHYRTGTVQRATDPTWFWWIISVQFVIAAVLVVIGCVQWSKLYG
jgi:hypothetical protein